MKTALVAAALATAAFTTQAHHVWIEQDDQGVKLYFGELGDNVRKTSPGRLATSNHPLTTDIPFPTP